MSCAVAIAAALALTDPSAAAAPVAPPTSFASEPLYADIIRRAQTLHGAVEALAPNAPLGEIQAQAQALSELDMKGHRDLAARGVDGDLKCILKGISEDLPRKVEQLARASGADRKTAVEELLYLLDDNAGVLLAPPKPPV